MKRQAWFLRLSSIDPFTWPLIWTIIPTVIVAVVVWALFAQQLMWVSTAIVIGVIAWIVIVVLMVVSAKAP